jgi:hypothetical protein
MRAALAIVLASATSVACVSYALPPEDAPAADAGAVVTITTVAAASSQSLGGKLSAVWAAYQIDDGAWQAISPKSDGLYEIPANGATWALALACDDRLFESSTIAIERHPATSTKIEITLPDPCKIQPPEAFRVTGTLSNIPTATSWFEFGYALESRGSVLPVQGSAASYELVNVASGTWDVAFAVRDTPSGPLTRAAILRAKPIAADTALDVDLGSATSFVPTTRSMHVHGVAADENLEPYVWYATGGPSGLAVGPQDVPIESSDVDVTYSTIPDAIAIAGDRYVFEITAQANHEDPTARVVSGSFHAPIPVDVVLPPAMPVPSAKITGPSRVETTYTKRDGALRYVVDVAASITRRSVRRFVTTIDARIATGVDTTPDLTSLAGFRPEWALPGDTHTEAIVTAVEPETPIGDGMMSRRATSVVVVTP